MAVPYYIYWNGKKIENLKVNGSNANKVMWGTSEVYRRVNLPTIASISAHSEYQTTVDEITLTANGVNGYGLPVTYHWSGTGIPAGKTTTTPTLTVAARGSVGTSSFSVYASNAVGNSNTVSTSHAITRQGYNVHFFVSTGYEYYASPAFEGRYPWRYDFAFDEYFIFQLGVNVGKLTYNVYTHGVSGVTDPADDVSGGGFAYAARNIDALCDRNVTGKMVIVRS